ncbi:hypothetical protein HG535_0C04290 [Zygotorulaspora mrakii]|uniref:YTH domain-containing protein n=1 Tax=Zygotorulaspora mrakii TaxID=42260 RepID=A0A7H9B051_ZYGMR|nr:uncharacterized protein HG535_0C04290 [Zygotorulaspora mrakii]QLG72075.1 hypothetical protein HG535_0C04290 [Zygotorulaspora mrakii]
MFSLSFQIDIKRILCKMNTGFGNIVESYITTTNQSVLKETSMFQPPKRTIEDSLRDLEFFVSGLFDSRGAFLPDRHSNAEHLIGDSQSGKNGVSQAAIRERNEVGLNDRSRKSPFLIPSHIDIPVKSRYFVIKSFCLEHVTESCAHGIWSSTYYGNRRLSEAYRSRDPNAKVYLFFSVNGSGKFCGVAEMGSDLQDNLDTSIWTEHNDKYGKAFRVKWVIVRNIHNRLLKQHLIPSNDMKPVTHSRDTQEIPEMVGVSMLHTFLYNRADVGSFLGEE